ncbi:MAG: sigma 54-interacting transcriptional regulator [Planctomycetota bacterium]
MAKLIVLEQDQKTTYNLTRDATTVGRAPDSHIPVRDPRASRRHARFEREGDEFFLVDEGSQNGTLVNGSHVERRVLRRGDLVEIGGVRIFFEEEDEKKLARGAWAGTRTVDIQAVVDEDEDEGALVRERDHLLRLQRVITAINSTLELEDLLGIIVDHAIELAEAERGFLILAGDGEMTFEVARNFAREEVAGPEMNISRTIAEKVLETGEPVLAVNALEDDRFREIHSISAIGLRSVLCLPFRAQGEVIGVLYIDNRLQKGVFSHEHLRMLEALAGQAATAIRHAHLFGELSGHREDLLKANQRIEKLNRVLRERVEKQQIELSRISDELTSKQSELEHRFDYSNIVGDSPAMETVFRRLDRIIPTEMPVLVQGQSGTGKELVARAIHYMGPRKKKKFVTENCAALTETLLESELFGYAKGAFTGATRDKKGLFEEASGGTLFLDEVGEMSREMQKKLLRVLQEKEIRPVGGKKTISVDVRIISASNRDLHTLVGEHEFREDLFYRLRVLTVDLPPLKERREDIPMLVGHFFQEATDRGEDVPEKIEPAVVSTMQAYDWPGNVRELQNEVRRLIALSDSVVSTGALSETIRRGRDAVEPVEDGEIRPLDEQVRALEVREIRRSLAATNGNKTRAAELLGISRFTLQRKLDKYELD